MEKINQKITTNLWFNTEAEEAANYYASIFKNSRIIKINRYSKAGQEIHKKSEGSVMTVEFAIEGQTFVALNGGPQFKFNEAISLIVNCKDQQEIDYYWNKLSEGGDKSAQQCGWLKDKYGLSWQIVPMILSGLVSDHQSEKSQRTMDAMMKMKKLDIEKLQTAYDGEKIKSYL
jgi:predicted 3-demethylubiquinone-9 3-methyltransferase (glyoxalase superfamily)